MSAPSSPGQANRHTTVYLVRHGETVFHLENRYAGRTEVELTEEGHAQAEALARWARTAGLAALYASTQGRARATAAPVAAATGLEVRTDARLVELDFGGGEGLTAAEMRARMPHARAAFETDPFANPLPGGEDPAAATARARAALADITAAHPGRRVLAVSHSTLLRLVLCDLLGIDPARYRTTFPVVGNATGAVLAHHPGKDTWSLLAFNPTLGTTP